MAIALGIEIVARVGFDRVSKIQRRTVAEYRNAEAIGRDRAAGQSHVLVVGNSLLDEDVRFDDVRRALADDWDVRRLVIEQTYYLDWYYGLRRLFAAGARPDVVVVMMTAKSWTQMNMRGDYSAHYMLDTTDVPAAARDLGLDLTRATSLFVSIISKFWATRAEMRNFVLGRMMPDLGRLMDFSSVVDPRPVVDEEVADVARGHLARVKALAESHSAQLVVILPAVLDPHDGSTGFLRAASAAGVTTIFPIRSGTVSRELYRDAGYHLNSQGAARFTERLIPALRQRLEWIKTNTQRVNAMSRTN